MGSNPIPSAIKMSENTWSQLHKNYQDTDWINKPSIFAEFAINYFPKEGKLLDLGAGQGQDSRYFFENGYIVTSTDISKTALEINKSKNKSNKISIIELDLTKPFPFEDRSFDIIYAHLSLHYFSKENTFKIFKEIKRVLKPSGILAFLVNSTSDPEYKTGIKIEEDFFKVGENSKRYFSVESAREFINEFEIIVLDNKGETYKDREKGIHNLIRFVGKNQVENFY